MDNIQKSILVVLGVAGLLVLMVPTSNKQADSKETPIAPQPLAPIPPAPADPANQQEEASDEFASDEGEFGMEDDLAAFGKPMIDASPPGEREESIQAQPNLPSGAIPPGPNYGGGTTPTPEPGPSAQ